jgi:hypothetical protein
MDWQMLSETTAAEVEAPVDDNRVAEIFLWRVEQLERAGYSRTHALSLADDERIDLHDACALLVRGCPERTAYLILS